MRTHTLIAFALRVFATKKAGVEADDVLPLGVVVKSNRYRIVQGKSAIELPERGSLDVGVLGITRHCPRSLELIPRGDKISEV